MILRGKEIAKTARVMAGMTQEVASEVTNVYLRTIQAWEQGKSVPLIDNLANYTQALGFELDIVIKRMREDDGIQRK